MSESPLREIPLRQPLALPDTALFRGAAEVVDVLRKEGHDAFLVGGAIRDLVMGKMASDADIATSARPKQVQALFRKTVPVGIEFGTVMVLLGGEQYEVTTFRADGRYEDGRRPTSVSFSNHITEDLERRDLTINGLIYDPIAEEVVDYTNGLADIEQGQIRTIGAPEDRFGEDRLRMLRAVRFAARLSFALDDATQQAIQALAPHLLEVSAERIQQELSKMLKGYPSRSMQWLRDTGLLTVILPQTEGREDELKMLLEALERDEWQHDEALAVLLSTVALDGLEALLRGLKFSKDQLKAVQAILQGQETLVSFSALPIADQKRFLRQPHIAGIMALGRARAVAQETAGWPKEAATQPTDHLQAAADAMVRWDELALSPVRLLDGHDLARLGYPKGKHYRDILQALETEQLEERLLDKEAALSWLSSNYGHLCD